MRLKQLLKPQPGVPFPLWMIFPILFAALYVTHFPLLRLPYYWDEAGYYIPAAWDFFRTGSLIPTSTLTNAHPPLPSIYLALWWKLSGFTPEVTRTAVVLAAALALLAVWRLAMRLHGNGLVAFATVALTLLYPVWFAQSTLAHADIFAAACSLWGLVYSLPDSKRHAPVAAAWFTAAALCKETSIVIPLTLAALALWEALRGDAPARLKSIREAAWLAACLVPLVAWYGWHYTRTGFLFGNPEFLRYNAEANTTPIRILAAFAHRVLHLTAHMNLFVPVLLALGALLLPVRDGAKKDGLVTTGINKAVQFRIFVLLLANAAFFSVLGGALLCRYLLPMYPLVLLLAISTLARHIRWWPALAVLSAAAFVAGIFIDPPYGFAPEDNLAYARMIRLHQAAIHELESHYTAATVLSAWPATDELSKPELGYVREPFAVFPIDDFSAQQIFRAAQTPQSYSAALVFSTKIDAANSLFTFGARSRRLDEQYFGLHHDMTPEEIAHQLGGTVVWKQDTGEMWAAVLRFNREYDAKLDAHPEPHL